MARVRWFRHAPAAALWLLPAALPAQVTGVGNFHQVNDRVWRSAQPATKAFGELAKQGVNTIVDLREAGVRSEREKRTAEAAGMHYVNVPLKAVGAPTKEEIARVLALLNDPANGRVLVHCRRGADRSGTVVACYRIAHDGWDNRRALAEARSFGMSPVERGMRAFILRYRAP